MGRYASALTPEDESQQQSFNPNTSFLEQKRFWVFYLFLFVCVYICLRAITPFSPSVCYVLMVALHTVVTFVLLHWIKGSPIEGPLQASGMYESLTTWEQMDGERQFTPTRKFLTLMPVALMFLGFYCCREYTILNIVMNTFIIVPKLPVLHKQRLLGINQ